MGICGDIEVKKEQTGFEVRNNEDTPPTAEMEVGNDSIAIGCCCFFVFVGLVG